MLISPAYAQDAGGAFGTMPQFLPLILIFAVFYFLLIRPQQQKQKQIKASLSALKRGDRVVTGGGMLGGDRAERAHHGAARNHQRGDQSDARQRHQAAPYRVRKPGAGDRRHAEGVVRQEVRLKKGPLAAGPLFAVQPNWAAANS